MQAVCACHRLSPSRLHVVKWASLWVRKGLACFKWPVLAYAPHGVGMFKWEGVQICDGWYHTYTH